MEKAIKLAVSAGFNEGIELAQVYYVWENEACKSLFIDPKFFQSLGKALGWNEAGDYCKSGNGCKEGEGSTHEGICQWEWIVAGWVTEWHRFIDHLIAGKDPEEFFNQLLS